MAAKKRSKTDKSSEGSKAGAKAEQKKRLDEGVARAKIEAAKEMHFAPTFLLMTVLVCSGALAVMSYRDMFGTGKVIFGESDAAMLQFTGSMKWFDDSNGWKSSQGGFSAVEKATTDDNDMGGFFVRKASGAAALGFHLQKILPLILQRSDAHWGRGHFQPLLLTSVLGDLGIAGYYITNLEDFKSAGAQDMGFGIAAALVIEALVMTGYLLASYVGKTSKLKAKSLPPGKGPKSIVSKILSRTVVIVSGFIALIAGRDFFFPGQEMGFPPYDDIYLEWTGAFIHSPPPGSVEAEEYGLEAPLHVGDKFVSRLTALYLLVACFQKLVAGFFIRVGDDNSGETKCRMFWQAQAIADGLLMFVIRVFAPAALTASFDVRWHCMALGYEFFIFAAYGFC